MHKGFKCLHVSSRHIYISRDVIFYESIFPLASLHSNASACYTSDVLLISSGNNDDTNLTNDPAMSLFPTDSTVPAFVHQPLPRIVVPDQVPRRLPPAMVEIPTESAGPYHAHSVGFFFCANRCQTCLHATLGAVPYHTHSAGFDMIN
jgi:hypothetical protein